MIQAKRQYTTTEVAEICRVSAKTVANWFDAGLLPGYRVPGSRHRRIPHAALKAFLDSRNLLTQLPGGGA